MRKYVRPLIFVAAVVALVGVQAGQALAAAACCRVFSNGAARALGSFRCNLSGVETRRLGVGLYEVDFDFADVRGYSKSAVLDTQTTGSTTGQIGVSDRAGDISSVFVRTTNSAGGAQDLAFDLCLH